MPGPVSMDFSCFKRKACEFAGLPFQLRPYRYAIPIASLVRGGQSGKARALASEPASVSSADRLNWLPFTDSNWNRHLWEGLELAGCSIGSAIDLGQGARR
jgi:hypothetical protein